MSKFRFNFAALRPLVRGFLVFAAVIATFAVLGAIYYPVRNYARRIVTTRSETSSVSIQLAAQPKWITPELSSLILDQARVFAQETSTNPLTGKPVKNFSRLQNPIDGGVLTDLANAFMLHQADHGNAWIKNILAIHRVYDRAANQQKITIEADYRKTVALVAQGDTFYQVDDDGIRLPGQLSVQDCMALQGRTASTLLVIRGTEATVPNPGQSFATPDFRAALQLVAILSAQPYARQIAAINVNNFGGRADKMAPQITLDTAFGTQIWWGRPAHDEELYEVSLPAKLNTLSRIAKRYSRIDASNRYVDIRFEQPRIPAPDPVITRHDPAAVSPHHG